MKNILRGLCIALLGLLLFACQNTQPETTNVTTKDNSSVNASSKLDPKTVEEVKELLAKHDKALSDKNLDQIMETFSSAENTVVLGTGQGERFLGHDPIKQAYTEVFKDYDAGTLNVSCDWKTGGVSTAGEMAWLAATCPAKDSLKGVTREYYLNVSGTVVKDQNGWRFVMLHMSNASDPGPPPAATNKN